MEGNQLYQENPKGENENLIQESEHFCPKMFDKKVLRMMKMMGYQSGFGLGKNGQGIIEPVKTNSQSHRKGFGANTGNIGLEESDIFSDKICANETLEWLQDISSLDLDLNEMMSWVKEGEPKRNIDEEYNFCDKNLLKSVIEAKNIFNEFDLKDLCLARSRANPFETIRSVFFMNRAALKMANIDAATDFMFTNIDENSYHQNALSPYYFADVCAGPGGFTEYVLWRKKWIFKGFGFTLKNENDFKLNNSVCSSPVTFYPFYGTEGDGNICNPNNIYDFKEKVLFQTDNEGVHFMMSDGGFSVEGNENIQEILSKKIYICQCLMALEIIRTNGHFVTKLFDIFTNFSVGLIYLISHCFEKVSIFKPNSSRPANSERYIIGCNYKGRENVENVLLYLRYLVNKLWEFNNIENLDVTEIVPLSILQNDAKYFEYIFNSNNRILELQIRNLKKLATFCQNPLLIEHRQETLRKDCLEYWKIPDKPKISAAKFSLVDLLLESVPNTELLMVQPRLIFKTDDLEKVFNDRQNWNYTFMQSKRNVNVCNFYAGVEFSKVYRLQSNKWIKVKNLLLAPGTLLYGEVVKEKYVLKECSEEAFKYSLHVIDALRLGDLDLSDKDFKERSKLIGIYCKSINHEFRGNSIRIRPKMVHSLGLPIDLKALNINRIPLLPVLGFNAIREYYDVNSILFLKIDKEQSFHSTYVLRIQLILESIETSTEKKKQSYSEALSHVVKT